MYYGYEDPTTFVKENRFLITQLGMNEIAILQNWDSISKLFPNGFLQMKIYDTQFLLLGPHGPEQTKVQKSKQSIQTNSFQIPITPNIEISFSIYKEEMISRRYFLNINTKQIKTKYRKITSNIYQKESDILSHIRNGFMLAYYTYVISGYELYKFVYSGCKKTLNLLSEAFSIHSDGNIAMDKTLLLELFYEKDKNIYYL